MPSVKASARIARREPSTGKDSASTEAVQNCDLDSDLEAIEAALASLAAAIERLDRRSDST
jgi:hypothetical protein